MITASHNPPEYNGYKVYGSDGGQVLAPDDQKIINEVDKILEPSQVKSVDALNNPLITLVEDEVDDAYLKAIQTLAFYPKDNKAKGNELKIVYSSLHGTGITLAPRALRLWGFPNFSYVDAQIIPDPDIPLILKTWTP
jgi:phosphoglucomutase/phosphomannomutase